MTVKDLINSLNKFHENAEVVVIDRDWTIHTITDVIQSDCGTIDIVLASTPDKYVSFSD